MFEQTLQPRKILRERDRTVILRMQRCGAEGCHCIETRLLELKHRLQNVTLEEVTRKIVIEWTEVDAATWVCHFHLDVGNLDVLPESMTGYLSRRICEDFPAVTHACRCVSYCQNSLGPCIHLEIGARDGIANSLKLLKESVVPQLLKTSVTGNESIESVKILWEDKDDLYAINHDGELVLEVVMAEKKHSDALATLQDACGDSRDHVDWSRSAPCGIQLLLENFGIEATCECIYQRLLKIMKKLDVFVDPVHLALVAEFCTNTGIVLGYNAVGLRTFLDSTDASAPFLQATLRYPVKSFEAAAQRAQFDALEDTVSATAWGKRSSMGTGTSFELLWTEQASEDRTFDLWNKLDVHEYLACVTEDVHKTPVTPMIAEDRHMGMTLSGDNAEGAWGTNTAMESEEDAWGSTNTAAMQTQDDAWGTSSTAAVDNQDNGWGTSNAAAVEENAWGTSNTAGAAAENDWGTTKSGATEVQNDGWGTSNTTAAVESQDDAWGSSQDIQKESGWGGDKTETTPADAWGSTVDERDGNTGVDHLAANEAAHRERLMQLKTSEEQEQQAEDASTVEGGEKVKKTFAPSGSNAIPLGNRRGVAKKFPWLEKIESENKEKDEAVAAVQESVGGGPTPMVSCGDDAAWGNPTPVVDDNAWGNTPTPMNEDAGWGQESEQTNAAWGSSSAADTPTEEAPVAAVETSFKRPARSGRQSAPTRPVDPIRKKFNEDVYTLVQSVRETLTRYQNGDRLSEDDELEILDNVLVHHPNYESKIGSGIDFLKVDEPPEHPGSTCFFIVRKDGSSEDFSYHKCLKQLVERNFGADYSRLYDLLFLKKDRDLKLSDMQQ